MKRKPPPRLGARGGTWVEYEAQKAKLAALGYHRANMSEVFESWRQSSDCKGEWYGVGEDRSIIDRAQKNLASCKDDESQRA